MPDKVAVPLPLSRNVTPLGSVPPSLSAETGVPVVVTLKVADLPVTKVALAAAGDGRSLVQHQGEGLGT